MPRETTRRRFIQSAGGTVLAAKQFMTQSRPSPNLLLIVSDQHRACSLPGEPYCEVRAPNLERLAEEGTTFRNCISNYPVCSPCRAMLLTGRWPYQTGIVDNSLPLRAEEISLSEVFKSRNYHTGYIGKWHLQSREERGDFIEPGPQRQGIDDWQVWYNTNPHYGESYTYDQHSGERLQPSGYNATLMTDAAVRFIQENRHRPWMLTLALNPPHPPWHDAPADLMKLYPSSELQLRPNALEIPRLTVGNRKGRVREMLQGYYAHITALDREIGRLLNALDETRQTRDTVVIYTTDHGEMLGSQGRMGKRLPYDESCRIPFIIRYPDVVPAARASRLLLSVIDVYPSICGLLGFSVPSRCAGQDLSETMRGEPVDSPRSAFIMHIEKDRASGGRNHPAPIFRGVVTPRYTYAVGEIGRWCLYDNQEDPFQEHNLFRDPEYENLMRDLDAEIVDWLRKAEDGFPFYAG